MRRARRGARAATLAWHPVGVYLCETFGFAEACEPALEVRNGVYTGIAIAIAFNANGPGSSTIP
ncbi:hypothetical protein AB0H36_11600 [Kribbella sp. NPDC050820]|uniref:hypothetical protein n=1 Tax=Kribbella sp. NPDC050820 TaxID=3155408 RepID=UPI0033CC71FD